MPKTRHPKEVMKSSEALLSAKHFTVGNNDQRNNAQASMTYRVDSTGGVPLGSHGETRGFAKVMAPPDAMPKGANRLFLNNKDHEGDCGLITRQVSAHQSDKLLGLNVIAEERYGVDSQGKVIGVSIQSDGSNIVSNLGVLQVDCRDPRIQKGLSDLQVIDFINGETDRHAGNIFIDPNTGKVTGIDNDLSFPEMDIRKVGGQALDKIVGMPRTIHEDTAKKILDADPEELRAKLSAPPPKNGPKPLSKAAIDGAVNRLKELQSELQNPTGKIKVVKKFDDNTYKAEMDALDVSFKKEQATFLNYLKDYQPKTTSELIQMTDQERAQLPPRAINCIDSVPKTSYLSTVEMEVAKNKILHGRPQHQPEHTVAPPSAKVPQVAFEKKLADGYAKMSKGEQRVFDKELELLNKLEDQLANKEKHLLKPSFTDKFNALTNPGGMQAVMDKKRNNAVDIADQVADLRSSLEQRAEKALGITPQSVSQSQSSVVDSSTSQSQSDDAQVKVNGPSSKQAVTKLLDVEEQSLSGNDTRSIGDDDGMNIDNDLNLSKKAPKVDEGSDVSVDVSESESVTVKNGQKPEAPELSSSESVRDMLRRTGAVQRAKTQLGLDKEKEHTVRKDSGIKDPPEHTEKTKVQIGGPH